MIVGIIHFLFWAIIIFVIIGGPIAWWNEPLKPHVKENKPKIKQNDLIPAKPWDWLNDLD